MTRPAEHLRLTVRVSGALAAVGVLLFGSAGAYHLWAAENARPVVYPTAYRPGEDVHLSRWEEVVLWGRGTDLDPEDVTCSSPRSGTSDERDVLSPGPPPGQEDLATIDHPEHGRLVYLATNVRPATHAYWLRCEGQGLESVFLSPNPRVPLTRGLGIGFTGAAVVAGLWAWLTLRPRRPGGPRTGAHPEPYGRPAGPYGPHGPTAPGPRPGP